MSIKKLSFLAGTWAGKGLAEYPTIETVEYFEELNFQVNELFPVIHYEQRTWVKNEGDLFTKPIFWESGFIIEKENDFLELCNVQKSGRMEILSGKITELSESRYEILFKSLNIYNDNRMIRSGRKYVFSENTLSYELKMSITNTPDYDKHLGATLTKQSDK
jgi:THAP4-like, heme-binding beta-barrel domain